MRPIKELLTEEYWEIAFRRYTEDDSAVGGGTTRFDVLPATARYWYADPFLFAFAGETYLFVEMFDNTVERGVIGCAKWNGSGFDTPRVVLEEAFHLSYPYVYEADGEIYMMPETHEDHCIQRYRAVQFPDVWVKDRVLAPVDDAVDTVFLGDRLLTSRVVNAVEMVTQLEGYDARTGAPDAHNPLTEANQYTRGAGRIFTHRGQTLRPAQNCGGAVYGAGLIFYQIESETPYRETEAFRLSPAQIDAGKRVTGIHTYARTETLEVVDIKARRNNARRLWWIVRNKLGR